jgi:hypothetical protein
MLHGNVIFPSEFDISNIYEEDVISFTRGATREGLKKLGEKKYRV